MKKIQKKTYGKYKKDVLKRVPQFAGGGFLQDIGDGLQNVGVGILDNALSPLGMNNVMDKYYAKNTDVDFLKKGYNFAGNLTKQVAPAVLGMSGIPGAGLAAQGIQQIGGQFNPQDPNNQPYKTFKKGGKMCYAMGGINAEVEDGEISMTPQGVTEQYNGNTHEQGGIPTNLQPGEMVFSDRIKVPGQKKVTFADAAKKYQTEKFDKMLKDTKATKLAKETAQKMFDKNTNSLNGLFELQERLKYIQEQKSALKQAQKGAVEKFAKGGTYGNRMFGQSNLNVTKPLTFNPSLDYNNPAFGQGVNQGLMVDEQGNPKVGTPNYQYNSPFPNMVGDNSTATPNSQGQNTDGFNWEQLGTNAAITGLNALGPASYLIGRGEKYDTVTPRTIEGRYLNPNAALAEANRNALIARQNAANLSKGNSQGYLSNAAAIASGNTMNRAAIMQDYQNKNNLIGMDVDKYNIAQRDRADDLTAQNKGVALQNKYDALNRLGTVGASGVRDYALTRNDNKLISNLKDLYPNFNFDDKNWRYTFVKTYGMSPEDAKNQYRR